MKHILVKKISILIFCSILFSFITGCSSTYLLERKSQTLTKYTIDATLNDEEHTLTVKQTVKYKNNGTSTLNNIKFNLYVKAFTEGATNKPVGSLNEQKAYPNGKSYGDIVFSSIKSEGQAITYTLEEVDKNILNVALLNELKTGYSTVIEMEYAVTLPNIHHRFGYGENTINLGNFYPIICVIEQGEFVIQPYSSNGDPFYSDLSNYIVNFTYPSKFVMASTGVKTNEQVVDDTTKKTTVKANTVRDFCAVFSDKFEMLEQKVGGTNVKYYYYNDENAQSSLNTAVKALTTFNNLIGEYPYSALSIVKTNFVHGGMEYPNLVYVSDSVDNYEDYTNVIIHEIAHQWWYGIVGNNAYTNGWLDEGLTEYTTTLFYELNPEYNIEKDQIIKNALTAYNMFQEVYEQIFGSVDTSLTRTLGDYKTEPEYVYMAYVKAMLLFDELREMLGDKKFFKALKYYYKSNRFETVTPEELINCFEKSTYRELNGWFDSWTQGKVIIKELN